VTVTPDTTAPAVRYAYLQTNLTTILAPFTEPIDPGVLSEGSNFTLTDTNTGTQITAAATYGTNGDATLVFEAPAPLDPTHGYSLGFSFVVDACAGNPMDDITIPVHSYRNIVTFSNTWTYLDNDIDPGATWAQPGFNDAGWASGPGPFDAKRDQPTAGGHCRATTLYGLGAVGTCINLTSPVTGTNLITAYFRTHFAASGTNVILELRGKLDDGGIIYLNGVELTRIGMPAGAVTKNTFASRTVNDGDAQDTGTFLFPAALVAGDNVLAVELHEVNLTSSDETMGLELTVVATSQTSPPPPPPRIRLSNNNGVVSMSWDAGLRLQCTTSLTPPIVWTDVTTNGETSYTVTPADSFSVNLDPFQETAPNPPGTRSGTGHGTVTVSNNTLVVDVTYSGLSGTRNNSHFHAPAPRGASAGVVYGLGGIDTGNGQTSGTIKGVIPLVNGQYLGKTIAQQVEDIRAGLWYLNIHSSTFGGGEIRGQLDGFRFYRLISP
jgi:hypothetical protein